MGKDILKAKYKGNNGNTGRNKFLYNRISPKDDWGKMTVLQKQQNDCN